MLLESISRLLESYCRFQNFFQLLFSQVKTGFMMNILGILCVSLAMNTWGLHMFNLDSYPDWAKPLNATEITIPPVNTTG